MTMCMLSIIEKRENNYFWNPNPPFHSQSVLPFFQSTLQSHLFFFLFFFHFFDSISRTYSTTASTISLLFNYTSPSTMENDSDDDDEWYRQMEDAAPVEWNTEQPPVLNKISCHDTTTTAEQHSEEEYFGNMQRYCEIEENAVELLPEQSIIWQQMARELQAESSFAETKLSSFSPLIPVMETENPSGMVLIEQFLFSHLPLSSRVYRALRLQEPSEPLSPDGSTEINQTEVVIDTDDVAISEAAAPAVTSSYRQLIFVDDILHPSLVVLVSQPECRHEAAMFSSSMPIETHLLTAVCKLLVWSNTPPCPAHADENQSPFRWDIHLGAVDSYAVQAITDGLQTMGYREKNVVPASLYVLNDPHRRALQLTSTGGDGDGNGGGGASLGYDDLSRRLLPKGYEFSRLQPEDAVLIDSCWKYRTSTSRRRIRALIAEYPCLGIRYTNDDGTNNSISIGVNNNNNHDSLQPSLLHNSLPLLVCWCLTYDYGALGMLHTLPAHRGRGLARELLSVLVDEWLRFDFGTHHQHKSINPLVIPYHLRDT